MQRVISETKRPVKIWATDLEPEAEAQVKRIANMPFIFNHVALMPDAHAGKGSTVGTVIATKGAIIPAAVGVDIGCGMCAVQLPFTMEQLCGRVKLSELRHSIERSVPTGFNQNKEVTARMSLALGALGQPGIARTNEMQKAALQCGSLGGGNHFIEICADNGGMAWVMLHSGSRNIGKVLAERHITEAKGEMARYFIDLEDTDLAYFVRGTPAYDAYITDLLWGQNYARANRNEMMLRVLKDISFAFFGEDTGPQHMTSFRVDCHHNYTSLENHFGQNVIVTRKGAVSAKSGEFGIVPGSMGTRSYIVRGLGNADSFHSCSHGAGRRMSRTQARKTFTVDDLRKQTEGVECRKDDNVLDEIPSSYKDIDTVMANQSDLCEVAFQLKQHLCIKGA